MLSDITKNLKIKNPNIDYDALSKKTDTLSKKVIENDLYSRKAEYEKVVNNINEFKDYKDNPTSQNLAKKYKVKINKDDLKKTNVVKGSVDTYSEMLEFQNEMMDNPENMFKLNIDPKKYPNLTKFFGDAKSIADFGEEYVPNISDSSVIDIPNISTVANALVGNIFTETAGRIDCGYYGNYKPNSGAPWGNWTTKNTKKIVINELSNYGFHTVPTYATKPAYLVGITKFGIDYGQDQATFKTYNWWNCGFNTFRDEAVWEINDITIKNNNPQRPDIFENSKYKYRSQIYSGYPGGEPNPEVFASGPWTYSDWPVYVAYWHATK